MKRKSIRRVVAVFFAVLLLGSLFPFAVFATDPVSAAVMANALAQAITAYGASNGVSMMFDVASSDGIGEAMHDLWGQFKTDVNDNNVPTYDSFAVTVWSTLFKKVGNNVAINLADTSVAYLDAFWNWLLSGPAEMQKVDDQYYQWTVDQQTGVVNPIVVGDYSTYFIDGYQVAYIQNAYSMVGASNWHYSWVTTAPAYVYGKVVPDNYQPTNPVISFVFLSADASSSDSVTLIYSPDNYTQTSVYGSWGNYGNGWLAAQAGGVRKAYFPFPYYENTLIPSGSSSSVVTSDGEVVSVRPYVGDATPQDVYIPDNEDVNYAPLPYVGPLNIPWQQEWGDGQTVSDAQGTSITGALDDAIVDDGTLQLEGDDVDVPSGDVIGGPDSYQVPGLADVFPFCIPFDIYNFLSALAAEPQAPSFECDLVFPEALGGTQTIELDFDTPTFNQLAQLLRLLELLAFIVGLALLTRSMFIRG